MSEQGEKTQRDLTKATKTSAINTRLLFTGIRTTNKGLQKTVEGLKNLTKGILTFNKLLYIQMNALVKTQQNLITTITSLVKELTKISRAPLHLAGLKTRTLAAGLPLGGGSSTSFGIGVGGKGIPPMTPFLQHFGRLIKKGFDVEKIFGDIEKDTLKKTNEISRIFRLYTAKILEFTGDLSSSGLGQALDKFITEYGKKIDKISEAESQKGMAIAGKMAKNFGLRMVLKGFEALKALIKQIIDVGKSPFTEMFGETLGGLIKILNTVLKPLKPFFFLLELIATVIAAALTPLTVYLWEELSVIFDDLVGMIPDLIVMVEGWIENDEELAETIQNIIDGVMDLVDAFVSGELFKKLYDLSVSLLTLAGCLVATDAKGVTLIERFIELAKAITDLAIAMIPLLPVIQWIVEALTGLVNLATGISNWWQDIWSGGLSGKYPPHPIQPFQEGGEVAYTGPIFAHAGETVHKKGSDDEMIRLLEEMIYLQGRILKMKEEKYR